MSTIKTTSRKKRSWIEMVGEQEKVRINRQRVNIWNENVETIHETFKKIIGIRRILLNIGEYELEEGEIL
jgi:hypothetical protein